MVQSSFAAGAQRSKAKNDPAQALSALGLSADAKPTAPAQ